jgi:hypothetical protein
VSVRMLLVQGQVPAFLGSPHHGPLPDSWPGPVLPETMNCSTSATHRESNAPDLWTGLGQARKGYLPE